MMAAAEVSETLSDFITCSICFNEFEGRDPRSLSCLHAFCRVCIESLLNNAGVQSSDGDITITCPLCNSGVIIPGGSPANLPHFFYGEGIREVVRSLRKQSVACKICKKAKVARYCIDCKAAICVKCKTKHDTRYADRHTDISITESTVKYLLCSDHDEYIDTFCLDCIKSVCQTCLLANHCDHRVSRLTNKKNACKSDELTETFIERTVLFNIELQKVITIQDKFNKEMKKTKEDLDRHHAQCISELNRQHQLLSTEIEEKLTKVNQELSALITNIIDSIENIQKLQLKIEKLLKPFPAVPDLALDCTEELLSETRHQIHSPPEITRKPVSLTFVRGSEVTCLGELKTGEELPTACIPELELPPIPGEEDELWQFISRKWPSGVKEVKFLPDGHLLIVRYNQMKVLDMDGNSTQHPVTKLHKDNINRIAVDDKTSSIAVVLYEKPLHNGYLHMYTNNDGIWTASIFEICKHPDSVSFTEEGNIIVGDDSGYLYFYKADGEEKWKRKLSSSATCITVTKQHVVLVGHNNKMVAYHINGKKLFTISCTDEQEGIDISGICVNSDGHILIADRETKAIHLYDNNGCYCREILSFDGKPESIAMFRNEYLAVVISHKLHFYSINKASRKEPIEVTTLD